MSSLDLGGLHEILQRYVELGSDLDRSTLERRLEQNPEDVETRVHLALVLTSLGDLESLFPQLKWFAIFEPLFGGTSAHFSPPDPRYDLLRDLRIASVKAHPGNEEVLLRAVDYLDEHDTATAIALLVEAEERNQDDLILARRAGAAHFFAASRGLACGSFQEALRHYERALVLHESAVKRFGARMRAMSFEGMPAMAALEASEPERARELAVAAVAAEGFGAPVEQHLGHTVLGRLFTRDGDISQGETRLRASSSAVKGHNFAVGGNALKLSKSLLGPSLRLAADLLAEGRQQPVVAYLRVVAPLWCEGQKCLDWADALERGEEVELVNHRR